MAALHAGLAATLDSPEIALQGKDPVSGDLRLTAPSRSAATRVSWLSDVAMIKPHPSAFAAPAQLYLAWIGMFAYRDRVCAAARTLTRFLHICASVSPLCAE